MSIARSVVARLRVRRRETRSEPAGRQLLAAFARTYPRATFVEVGSNDGLQHDHLRPWILKGSWRGVMVEPVPYVFERLRANYGAIERVALERAAIGERDEERTFHYLRAPAPGEDELPDWYDGIGSLSLQTIRGHGHKVPDLEDRLVAERVRCMTLDSLCRRHRIESLDLLVIDAEGYDARVLSAVDLASIRPRLIVYEHFHLHPAERRSCRARLHGFGYETFEEGFDTWCLDVGCRDELTRLWRRLKPVVPAGYVEDETL